MWSSERNAGVEATAMRKPDLPIPACTGRVRNTPEPRVKVRYSRCHPRVEVFPIVTQKYTALQLLLGLDIAKPSTVVLFGLISIYMKSAGHEKVTRAMNFAKRANCRSRAFG